jgi:hypothetical protein
MTDPTTLPASGGRGRFSKPGEMISKPDPTKPKPGATKSKPDATKTKFDFLPQFEPFQGVKPLFAAFLHSFLWLPGRSSGSGAASDEYNANPVFGDH